MLRTHCCLTFWVTKLKFQGSHLSYHASVECVASRIQDESLNAMTPPGIYLAIIHILYYIIWILGKLKTESSSQLSLNAYIPQGFPHSSACMWVRDNLLPALPSSSALASTAAQPVHAQTNDDPNYASVQ